MDFCSYGNSLFTFRREFFRIGKKAQLEVEIRNKLVNETITVGEGVNKTKIEVDWTKTPPIVYVTLQTDKEITPNQASLVEKFIQRRMGRQFEIVFIVSEITQVTSKQLKNIPLAETKTTKPKPIPTPNRGKRASAPANNFTASNSIIFSFSFLS